MPCGKIPWGGHLLLRYGAPSRVGCAGAQRRFIRVGENCSDRKWLLRRPRKTTVCATGACHGRQHAQLLAAKARYITSVQATFDQTASSLPLGSEKWNRRPPGNSNVGLVIFPSARMMRRWMASRSEE